MFISDEDCAIIAHQAAHHSYTQSLLCHSWGTVVCGSPRVGVPALGKESIDCVLYDASFLINNVSFISSHPYLNSLHPQLPPPPPLPLYPTFLLALFSFGVYGYGWGQQLIDHPHARLAITLPTLSHSRTPHPRDQVILL